MRPHQRTHFTPAGQERVRSFFDRRNQSLYGLIHGSYPYAASTQNILKLLA
jgi:hypothetical protein